MLIEFSVSNFRSFRERQTLSMVAASRMRKGNKVFKPELTGEKFPDLLKVAVIYGPNASGKSNLLKALDIIQQMASRNPNQADMALPVAPFRFDAVLANQPSVFEVHFIHAGLRYQFDLSMTTERIVQERLVVFPKGVETLLYNRHHENGADVYTYGDTLEGGSTIFEAWRKLTPPSMLFISQAVANSNEELMQLRQPFSWLKKGMHTLLDGMEDLAKFSQFLAIEGKQFATEASAEIATFLSDVDVPISGIKVELKKSIHDSESDVDALESRKLHPFSVDWQSKVKTVLTHRTALGEAEIDYADQSEGTKNLIGFWLPWTTKALKEHPQRVLVVDEMDSSLHPLMVAALVKKHLDSDIDTQLIFTTHDTHLMDTKLLRRDQIWLTERDMNGATQLRSIHDFEGREGEDVEKRYFEGRYRGLPLIKKD
jgi:AAA15 family ATPase/GTPase